MQGIRLVRVIILLTGFAAGQPAANPAPPPKVSVTLKKGNCDSLPKGCEKSLTDQAAVQRCRANTKSDCTLKAVVTKRAIDNTGLDFSSKHIMGNKVTVPPIPGFTVKSINIQGEGITAESRVVFNKELTTDPKTWTTSTVTGCTVAEETKTISCTNPTFQPAIDLNTLPEFFLVVVEKDKTPIDVADSKPFIGSIELENKAFPAIPTLTAKDAKFQLKWDDKCKVTGEDACLNEIANLAGLKKCLEGHKADGCIVTPTVKFSRKDIKTTFTGIQAAEHQLPVVAIDASELKDSVFELTNLRLTAINFGLQTAVTGTSKIIMNNDLKNLNDTAVTGTIDDKGHVTDTVGGGVTDFSGVVFAYLVPTDLSKDTPGPFDPVIELTGPETAHEESHEKDVDQNAVWKVKTINPILPNGCKPTNCRAVKDLASLNLCVNVLKRLYKGNSLSVDAAVSSGKSTAVKILGKDYALFEIKSIEGFPNLNLGLYSAETNQNPTRIKITITKIEGKFSGTGTPTLVKLTYNPGSEQYTVESATLGKLSVNSTQKTLTVTDVNVDIADGKPITFGLALSPAMSLRSLQATDAQPKATELTDIVITFKTASIEIEDLVLSASDITATTQGLSGLMSGGLLLTGATLIVSWTM